MDQVEMENVHVIQVIQLLKVQTIIVPFVHLVMLCKVQFVSNVMKPVKLVFSTQLIALRIIYLL